VSAVSNFPTQPAVSYDFCGGKTFFVKNHGEFKHTNEKTSFLQNHGKFEFLIWFALK